MNPTLDEVIRFGRGEEAAELLLKNGKVVNVFTGEILRADVAGTVAHDSHNLIVAGTNDADMITAVHAVIEADGGFAVVADRELLKRMSLPIAGLMSESPFEVVRKEMDELLSAASDLGSPLENPFMTLSFLALPVIPALKLTDLGLVDVNKFAFVSLFV